MGSLGNDIYALNESLLDDIEADEVADEEAVQSAEYRFMFHFKCDYVAAVVKNVFFNTAMEPALGRLKSMGLVESWKFVRKYGKAEDVPNLSLYAGIVENSKDLKHTYGKSAVLSVDMMIPESAENADDIMTIAVFMFQYALGCKLDSNGGLRMAFRKHESETVYDIFFEKGKRWAFHCGINGRNLDISSKKLAGMFIRKARNLGFMEAADDARSRFIAYTFGSGDDYKLCMFDSGGNCLFSHKVEPYRAGTVSSGFGKFNEYGLLLVRFSVTDKNFLRMDGSKLTSDDFDSDFTEFWDGYFQISRKDKNGVTRYNLIDKDGNMLLGEWCTYVGNFVDGIAIIWKDDVNHSTRTARNFIDKSGKPVLSEWYDYINFESVGTPILKQEPDFKRSVARIGKYDRDRKALYYNYADRTGKFLLKDWIRGDCGVMENGFAKLCRFTEDGDAKTSKYNYMRADGSLVSEEWFDELAGWPERGMFAARTGKDWAFMDTGTCKVLFGGTVFEKVDTKSGEDGFDHYEVRTEPYSSYGFANLISPDGTMCCDKMEYVSVNYVGNGFADVRRKAFGKDILWKWGEGPVELGKELSSIAGFRGNYARVFSYKQKNLIDADGNLVSDTWFGYIGDIDGGFAGVMVESEEAGKSDVWDLLACKTGVLIFGGSGTTQINRHYAISPDEVVAVQSVRDNRFVYNMFDADGNQLLGEWTDFPIESAGDGLVRIGPNSYADYSGNIASFV